MISWLANIKILHLNFSMTMCTNIAQNIKNWKLAIVVANCIIFNLNNEVVVIWYFDKHSQGQNLMIQLIAFIDHPDKGLWEPRPTILTTLFQGFEALHTAQASMRHSISNKQNNTLQYVWTCSKSFKKIFLQQKTKFIPTWHRVWIEWSAELWCRLWYVCWRNTDIHI